MVQKTGTSLSIIFSFLILMTGCYRILASPSQLKKVEKNLENIEGELSEMDKRDSVYQKHIMSQFSKISSENGERKLFFSTMDRQKLALLQDMSEFQKSVNSFLENTVDLFSSLKLIIKTRNADRKVDSQNWKNRIRYIDLIVCKNFSPGQNCMEEKK